jgi:hypothetical protein
VFGSDLVAMQRTGNNKKNKRFMGGRYARTEEELYRKAVELLDKCKVEDRRWERPAERSAAMGAKRRRKRLVQRLNAFDTGITEEDRRTERHSAIERTIEIEQALKWGRLQ